MVFMPSLLVLVVDGAASNGFDLVSRWNVTSFSPHFLPDTRPHSLSARPSEGKPGQRRVHRGDPPLSDYRGGLSSESFKFKGLSETVEARPKITKQKNKQAKKQNILKWFNREQTETSPC